jgi:hypothetical protein
MSPQIAISKTGCTSLWCMPWFSTGTAHHQDTLPISGTTPMGTVTLTATPCSLANILGLALGLLYLNKPPSSCHRHRPLRPSSLKLTGWVLNRLPLRPQPQRLLLASTRPNLQPHLSQPLLLIGTCPHPRLLLHLPSCLEHPLLISPLRALEGWSLSLFQPQRPFLRAHPSAQLNRRHLPPLKHPVLTPLTMYRAVDQLMKVVTKIATKTETLSPRNVVERGAGPR